MKALEIWTNDLLLWGFAITGSVAGSDADLCEVRE